MSPDIGHNPPSPDRNNKFQLAPLLLVLTVSLWVALPQACRILWTSDDYSLVYGVDGRPVPGWEQSLKFGGVGVLSVHRLANYPWVGYVGWACGPAVSHVIQVLLHLACGVCLWLLLCRLRFPSGTASWAVLFFLISPWVSQPVFWWSSSSTVLHTILILLSMLCFVKSLDAGRRWFWVSLAGILIFLSLTVYELWLCSWPAFVVIAWYRLRIEQRGVLFQFSQIRGALVSAVPLMIPYALWGGLFVLTHTNPDAAHQPVFSLARIPIVFLSVQLRSVQWITQIDWLQSLSSGGKSLWTPLGIVCCVLAAVQCALLIVKHRQEDFAASSSNQTSFRILMERLLLAWGIFLSARLVFLLQGGVSLNTRHNYGGAMAWGIAFAALGEFLEHKWSRRAANVLRVLILLPMGIAMSGVAAQYARNSHLEEAIHRRIVDDLNSTDREIRWVLVIGNDRTRRGEMPPYFEAAGTWLEYRLRAEFPEINASFVPRIEELQERLNLRTHPPQERDLSDFPSGETWIYELGEGGRLQRRTL